LVDGLAFGLVRFVLGLFGNGVWVTAYMLRFFGSGFGEEWMGCAGHFPPEQRIGFVFLVGHGE